MTSVAAVDRGQKEVMTAIDREKLELLKRKAAQAEAAQEVTGSQLTPEEKEAEYRRIFGMT